MLKKRLVYPKRRNYEIFTIKGIICTHIEQKDKSVLRFDGKVNRKGKEHENFHSLKDKYKFEENSLIQVIKGNNVIPITGNKEYNH